MKNSDVFQVRGDDFNDIYLDEVTSISNRAVEVIGAAERYLDLIQYSIDYATNSFSTYGLVIVRDRITDVSKNVTVAFSNINFNISFDY